jgi:anti-anti-sigma factor
MANGFIRTTRIGTGVWVVSLVGEHDVSTAPPLRRDLEAMSRTGTGIVLDLSEATFIDSTIIEVIVSRDGESFALVVPATGAISRLLDLVGIAGPIPTYRSRFVACRAVAPRHRMLRLPERVGASRPAPAPVPQPADAPAGGRSGRWH